VGCDWSSAGALPSDNVPIICFNLLCSCMLEDDNVTSFVTLAEKILIVLKDHLINNSGRSRYDHASVPLFVLFSSLGMTIAV